MIVIKLWFCIFQIKICMFVFVCINVCVCKNPEFRTELSTNRGIFFYSEDFKFRDDGCFWVSYLFPYVFISILLSMTLFMFGLTLHGPAAQFQARSTSKSTWQRKDSLRGYARVSSSPRTNSS